MNKKLNIKRVVIAVSILVLALILLAISVFFFMLSPVSGNKESKPFVVESGTSTYEVFSNLESEGLIRSSLFMKAYSVLTGGVSVDAGVYNFNENLGSIKIFKMFKNKEYTSGNQISLTFPEGFNINKLIEIVTSKTSITESEIKSKLKDKDYLRVLIDKYWFLTDDILNDRLYYSLEGYLFPNTYFIEEDSSIDVLFDSMLKETQKVLDPYKDKIEASKYSIHELMTVSSIVELEAAYDEDRVVVAGVFLNRLNNNESLGSCVTTYYAVGKTMGETLYVSDINTVNDYNTRADSSLILPVGPISNPGKVSIESIMNPQETDYYYFVSDKYMKLYFTKTYNEHVNKINELKREGLWLE